MENKSGRGRSGGRSRGRFGGGRGRGHCEMLRGVEETTAGVRQSPEGRATTEPPGGAQEGGVDALTGFQNGGDGGGDGGIRGGKVRRGGRNMNGKEGGTIGEGKGKSGGKGDSKPDKRGNRQSQRRRQRDGDGRSKGHHAIKTEDISGNSVPSSSLSESAAAFDPIRISSLSASAAAFEPGAVFSAQEANHPKEKKGENPIQRKQDRNISAPKQTQRQESSVLPPSPGPRNRSQLSEKTAEKEKKGEKNRREHMEGSKGLSKSFTPTIPPNQPQTTNSLEYGRGENITVLHVAEKPSIGQAIAHALCPSGGSRSGKMLPVHDFTGPPFSKAPKASKCNHRVTSVAGHVFNVDFPPQYQSWDSVDPAELFMAPVVKKPCKGSVVKHLQDEARGVDFIVLWMDCDREGENINFEVLDCCMHLMRSGGGSTHYDRVYRAHFSAINPSDIHKAYNALGKPDKCQSLSVEARQELDLKVGVAFSRFQTRFFQGRYGDLDSAVLSYGPCQTPTLGFCVQRHIDIETFKSEPYWLLDLGIMKRGKMCRAVWDSGRSFNMQKVQGLVSVCTKAPRCMAKVTSMTIKEKKQGRPTPLNTVAMLKACSKALGIGPHAAMQTAERLYLSGYLSCESFLLCCSALCCTPDCLSKALSNAYRCLLPQSPLTLSPISANSDPRTESTAYPKSFDVHGALKQQCGDNRWGTYVHNLLSHEGPNKSKGGVDMGDHPPIIPCRSAGPGELSGDMARVYDLVTRHFIASVSHDAVWQATKVTVDVDALGNQGQFTIQGKVVSVMAQFIW